MTSRPTRPHRHGGLHRGLVAASLLTVAAAATVGAASTSEAKPDKAKAVVTVTKLAGVPKATTAGARIKATATVKNVGKATSAKKTVVVLLSRNAKLDRQDARLGSARVTKLRPRASKRAAAAVSLPKGLSPGTYYVLACVDDKRCKAVRTVVRAAAPSVPDQGTLTGRLTLQRATPYPGWTTLGMNATIDVTMRYIGPFTRTDELLSTGSSYSLARNLGKKVVSGDCVTTTEDLGGGGGPLKATGDRYNDDIYGSVVLNDLSEISLTTTMLYSHHERTTLGGAPDCLQGTTDGPTSSARITTDMKLKQVSRTPTSITYQVTSWVDAYGAKSDWEQVTGTLTLNLG